ncbi:MAG: universal stress protein [Candidatus Limnocylindria bacterium]|nr:universal stress protein [Candidatus Limnocylindria bacterium]
MRVLLAYDGSPQADVARMLVAGLPWPAGTAVRLVGVVPVHVVTVLPLRLEVTEDATARHAAADPAYALAADRAREACRRLAHQTAGRFSAAGFDAHYAVRSGDPAAELLDAASELDADLIAMGTRGRTGLERVLLGSVARSVLHRATCSVLVARRSVRP